MQLVVFHAFQVHEMWVYDDTEKIRICTLLVDQIGIQYILLCHLFDLVWIRIERNKGEKKSASLGFSSALLINLVCMNYVRMYVLMRFIG